MLQQLAICTLSLLHNIKLSAIQDLATKLQHTKKSV
uniref:Uncharacterized protein n=1 Tax=Anguilla anguilla TaxID=7936 RepID=A0A0E9XU03_ANGAN